VRQHHQIGEIEKIFVLKNESPLQGQRCRAVTFHIHCQGSNSVIVHHDAGLNEVSI